MVNVGLMSSSRVVKSPTAAEPAPTFVLAPLVLMRTCNLSGKVNAAVLVQNEKISPFFRVRVGVISQLLMVFAPVVLLKLAPM